MRTGLFLFIALFFSSTVFASVEITEIMYAPNAKWGGPDNEWIELYNNGENSANLSGCVFNNKNLTGEIDSKEYFLLARNKHRQNVSYFFNLSENIILEHTFLLANTGSTIIIGGAEDCNNSFNYTTYVKTVKEGKTLEKTSTGEWKESLVDGGTPGRSNSVNEGNESNEEAPPRESLPKTAEIVLSTNLDEIIYLNNQYTSLFSIKIENKNCSKKDTVTVHYNISKQGSLVKDDSFTKEIGCSSTASTGSFIPQEAGNYTLCGTIINSTVNETNFNNNAACADFEAVSTFSQWCDINLEISGTNQTIFYENGQTIKFTPEINNESFPFIIEYWIEDLFGGIVKDKFNTTNTNQKSWKTDIVEEDRVLLIKAAVYPACNDTDLADNVAESMFIVVKNEEEEIYASSTDEINSAINIIEISPQPASFGGVIKADVEIYKNSTNKYSLSAWAEKSGKVISEKTKVSLKTKNTRYELTLPVQIKPNCDAKITGGAATLVVEGLGASAEKEFIIGGIDKDLCKESAVYPEKENIRISEAASNAGNMVQIIGLPAEIHAGEAFRLKVQFPNNGDAEFTAWSYLYRGSKCYSCFSGGRDENTISFSVVEDETKVVEMLVAADQGLTEGEYNLMVKYKKDNQKTEKSISQKIYVNQQARYSNQSLPLFSNKEGEHFIFSKEKADEKFPEQSGIVVYESTAERSKNLISWVLFIAFGLLSLVLIIKRG